MSSNGAFVVIEETQRKNKIEDYKEYLDRTRRTNGKTRFDTHQTMMARNTARYYGLSEKEILSLDEEFKKDNHTFLTPSELEAKEIEEKKEDDNNE